MKVRDIMVESPKYCEPDLDCARAIEMLWSGDCGALPVLNAEMKVVGIVTDRDICVALGTRNVRPSELQVRELMTSGVACCGAEDNVQDALKTMRSRKIRRLPVVDGEGRLEGMLCATDIIVNARRDDGTKPELSYENVVSMLRGICWHTAESRH